MNVLTIERVSVRVNDVEIIKDISLDLDAGEVVAVIGPNGAGKTTLLNALAGDIALSSGNIMICGKSIDTWSLRSRACSVGVLPQLSLLNFPYSVDEVVGLGRTPHSTGVKIDREIVKDAMKIMDIEYLTGREYTRLSGGEKQRTQLARVMAQIWRKEDAEKRLLLLDEPTTALDLGHQQMLMDAVGQFTRQGVGVVMVVHDVNLAAKYAHRVLALSCGRMAALGDVNAVLTEELFTNLFGANVQLVTHPQTQKTFVIP